MLGNRNRNMNINARYRIRVTVLPHLTRHMEAFVRESRSEAARKNSTRIIKDEWRSRMCIAQDRPPMDKKEQLKIDLSFLGFTEIPLDEDVLRAQLLEAAVDYASS